MSGDNRPVATDALHTLGTIIDDQQKRDAIHLAVIPMQAAQRLFPGQDIGTADGMASTSASPLGIVDPFLKVPVQQGEWFWMVIYPRTITSLRHVWSHPALPDEPQPVSSRAASEAWLRDFVARSDCPTYESVIGKAVEHINGIGGGWDDDYLHFNGSDAHGEIPDEFWSHIEAVTGLKATRRATYFSCSC